jgi:hypothetical protein
MLVIFVDNATQITSLAITRDPVDSANRERGCLVRLDNGGIGQALENEMTLLLSKPLSEEEQTLSPSEIWNRHRSEIIEYLAEIIRVPSF